MIEIKEICMNSDLLQCGLQIGVYSDEFVDETAQAIRPLIYSVGIVII